MLKEIVTYEDFDGEQKTEELYFNLSKAEILDNLDLQDEVRAIQKMIGPIEETESRELTVPQVRQILELVKRFMQLSYGVRDDKDGKQRFRKNPELWIDFVESAAYDSFLMSLFTNPEKSLEFVAGVMPKDLMDQVRQEQGLTTVGTYADPDTVRQIRPPVSDRLQKQEKLKEAETVTTVLDDELPAWFKEQREPTQAEIAAMPPEEFKIYQNWISRRPLI